MVKGETSRVVAARLLLMALALVPSLSLGSGKNLPNERQKPNLETAFDVFGQDVNAGIAGSIQLDLIHDFDAIGIPVNQPVPREFITALIPVGGPAAQQTGRTVLSPNQTRLYGWAATMTALGELHVLTILNLEQSTTATEFQVYRATARVGWLRGGRNYAFILNRSTIPDTLDWEGPQSLPEIRRAQGSIQIPLLPRRHEYRELFFALALEEPISEITLPLNPTLSACQTTDIPAVSAKLILRDDHSDLQLGAIYRRLEAEGVGYQSSVNGWALNLSGSWAIGKKREDKLILGLLGGYGIAAYINDVSGLNLDAAPISENDPQLKAVGLLSILLGFEHLWSKYLYSTFTYGYLRVGTNFIAPIFDTDEAGIYRDTHFVSSNLLWKPFDCCMVGIEYLYGRRRVTAATAIGGSTSGSDHRLQASFSISYGTAR